MSFSLAQITAGAPAQSEPLSDAFAESYTAGSVYNYNKAIQILNSVYDPDSYELNLRLGWLYYLSGQHARSLHYYKKSARKMPCSIEARLGCVLPASAMGNWQAVTGYYREILKIDLHHCKSNYYMGLISYNKGEYLTSAAYLERVLKLYPFDYDTAILLAWCNYKLGKKTAAAVLFRRALLAAPDDNSALLGLNLIK